MGARQGVGLAYSSPPRRPQTHRALQHPFATRLFRALKLRADKPQALEAADRRLRSQWSEARSRWEGVELDAEAFVDYVAERLPATKPLEALESLHGVDLYLAAACYAGSTRALSAFEERVIASVARTMGRSGSSASLVDEALQRLRARLFLDQKTGRPRIAEYSGRGALVHWARAAGVRILLDLQHGRREDRSLDHSLANELAADQLDPEMAALREQSRDYFKVAFDQALKRLTTKERNLLRLHVVEGLTFEAIGKMHRVHRSTAMRWIEAAREKIIDDMKKSLAERLQLRRSQIDSLMRMVRTQLEVSLSPLLR